jgi:hypothetical protein
VERCIDPPQPPTHPRVTSPATRRAAVDGWVRSSAGAVATIVGLTGAVDLNGMSATLEAFDGLRWLVAIHDTGEQKNVKFSNLVVDDAHDATGAPP